jgi:hypothetical protein
MAPRLSHKQLAQAGNYVFQHGRLLERQIYAYLFQNGSCEACLKALLAYQNPDGGFGNGIEPDLLCPETTAIGAETAMVILDMLGWYEDEIVAPLVKWIAANQDERGVISHPPKSLLDYPHQSWWENADDSRILTLAGLLRKWGVDAPEIYAGARRYYLTCEMPDRWAIYSYPIYVYLKYCREGNDDQQRWPEATANLSALLEESADHYPLFSRYWYHAADAVPEEILRREAGRFVDGLQEDGALITPYPDLPWWRPIFTVDGLMVMRQLALV